MVRDAAVEAQLRRLRRQNEEAREGVLLLELELLELLELELLELLELELLEVAVVVLILRNGAAAAPRCQTAAPAAPASVLLLFHHAHARPREREDLRPDLVLSLEQGVGGDGLPGVQKGVSDDDLLLLLLLRRRRRRRRRRRQRRRRRRRTRDLSPERHAVPQRARAESRHQFQHASLGDGDVLREDHGVLFFFGGGEERGELEEEEFFFFFPSTSAVSKIDAVK